jgi:hypothetical protein
LGNSFITQLHVRFKIWNCRWDGTKLVKHFFVNFGMVWLLCWAWRLFSLRRAMYRIVWMRSILLVVTYLTWSKKMPECLNIWKTIGKRVKKQIF